MKRVLIFRSWLLGGDWEMALNSLCAIGLAKVCRMECK